MSLFADFQSVAARLNNVWSLEHPDNLKEESPALGIHADAALSLPPKLAATSDRLHELGAAGRAAQICVYHLGRAREYVTQDASGQVIFDQKRFYDHLWSATGSITTVLNKIDGMFDAKG